MSLALCISQTEGYHLQFMGQLLRMMKLVLKTIDSGRDRALEGNVPSLFDKVLLASRVPSVHSAGLMFQWVKQPRWPVSGLSPARTGNDRPPSGLDTPL